MQTYTTVGNVRGCCGHKHRSIRTALMCLKADQVGCVKQGGYSDRDVVYSDRRHLTLDDQRYIDELEFTNDY